MKKFNLSTNWPHSGVRVSVASCVIAILNIQKRLFFSRPQDGTHKNKIGIENRGQFGHLSMQLSGYYEVNSVYTVLET